MRVATCLLGCTLPYGQLQVHAMVPIYALQVLFLSCSKHHVTPDGIRTISTPCQLSKPNCAYISKQNNCLSNDQGHIYKKQANIDPKRQHKHDSHECKHHVTPDGMCTIWTPCQLPKSNCPTPKTKTLAAQTSQGTLTK